MSPIIQDMNQFRNLIRFEKSKNAKFTNFSIPNFVSIRKIGFTRLIQDASLNWTVIRESGRLMDDTKD